MMGAGLLAGLGKGIAAAGDVFAGTMVKAELSKQEEERRLRAAEAAELRKEQRAEAKAQQEASTYSAAQEAATGVGFERRFEKFKKDLGATDMSEEELRSVFKENYDQQVVTDEVGGDRYVEKYSRQKEDILNELRRAGASSGQITAAAKDVETTRQAELTAEREARVAQRERERAELDRKRFEETQRANRESERIREITANRPPASATVKPGDLTEKENKRIEVIRDDIKSIDAEIKALSEQKVYGKKVEERDNKINELKTKREGLVKQREEIMSGGGSKPESKPAPKSGFDINSKTPPAKAPSVKDITGAPAGAKIGSWTPGKGWEIRDSKNRLLGYAKE